MGLLSLEDSGELDVLKLVSTMRQDRGGMVQSRTQYIFLHKVCVIKGVKFDDLCNACLTCFDMPCANCIHCAMVDVAWAWACFI